MSLNKIEVYCNGQSIFTRDGRFVGFITEEFSETLVQSSKHELDEEDCLTLESDVFINHVELWEQPNEEETDSN